MTNATYCNAAMVEDPEDPSERRLLRSLIEDSGLVVVGIVEAQSILIALNRDNRLSGVPQLAP
jgi:hypothetical protein